MRKFYPSLAIFLLTGIFCFKSAYATNFLQNPGFEEEIIGWTSASTIILSAVSNPTPHTGDKALKIENKSGTASAGAEQEVTDITGGGQYLVSGFVMFTDPNVKEAKIRMAWYKSGETSQFDFVDTNILKSPVSSWTELSKIIVAPSQAARAEIRLVISKNTKDPAVAYFDDIFFQPDYTPEPTATQTQPAAPTPAKTKTTTTTNKSAPRTTTPTETTTQILPKTQASNQVNSPAILSSSSESADFNLTASESATSSSDVVTAKKVVNKKLTFALFIIAGVLFSISAFVYYLRNRTK